MFFFSSRRRHTRSLRDWSSDVCSSDLTLLVEQHDFASGRPGSKIMLLDKKRPFTAAGTLARNRNARSEERRVGKERRSLAWPGGEKEKRDRESPNLRRSRDVRHEGVIS